MGIVLAFAIFVLLFLSFLQDVIEVIMIIVCGTKEERCCMLVALVIILAIIYKLWWS